VKTLATSTKLLKIAEPSPHVIKRQHMQENHHDPVLIGWRERIGLPSLGIPRVTAKIDTGARTSCLHAFAIEEFQQHGATWVRFGVHPYRRNTSHEVWCEAQVIDERTIRASSGHQMQRYVIETQIELAGLTWTIEMSLANRDDMGYRMLLGRTALQGHCIIDPEQSYQHSSPKSRRTK